MGLQSLKNWAVSRAFRNSELPVRGSGEAIVVQSGAGGILTSIPTIGSIQAAT
jgi:hypothetical protein